MSSADEVSRNIVNAFQVLRETHASIQQLIEYLNENCEQFGYKKMDTNTPGFLRWKSDTNYWGWTLYRLVLLFQSQSDSCLEGEGTSKRGPVYLVEIELAGIKEGTNLTDHPTAFICEFTYENPERLVGSWSPTSIWCFDQPLHWSKMVWTEKDSVAYGDTPNGKPLDKYLGLQSVKCMNVPLATITAENAGEIVFVEGFDRLRALD